MDRLIMASPGLKLVSPGNLRLWQSAAASLDLTGLPVPLDQARDDVSDTWARFLMLDTPVDWFDSLSSMMAEYCQFWKSVAPFPTVPQTVLLLVGSNSPLASTLTS
ncbi:hypothetical protein C2S52_006607 [Perilla frutescens var. hirtella]|nr:hypothetical protein C2S51_009204 [Perilla frutescens var. frutescens]KAH6787055.1 hypothetical protein C2S52_006607 [Perilla frutescens var. hirtella]